MNLYINQMPYNVICFPPKAIAIYTLYTCTTKGNIHVLNSSWSIESCISVVH